MNYKPCENLKPKPPTHEMISKPLFFRVFRAFGGKNKKEKHL